MISNNSTPPQRSWLLLRGLGRESGHWGDFPARLQAARPQDRVLLLDLPGNGALHRQSSPAQIDAMTEHCRTALRAQGKTGPVHLLCLSMGGMVAVDWACRYPDEIAALVLISSSLRGLSRWHQRMRPVALLRLLSALISPSLQWRESQALALSSAQRPLNAALLQHWCALQQARPVQRLNLLRQLLAAARFRAPQTGPSQPLLVLAGAGDRLVDPVCSERIAAAWQGRHALHSSAGHDLTLDDGAWVIEQIGRWLDSLEGR